MRISEMLDAEFAYLERRIETLEIENEQLRRENGELLVKYIAAQDLAHTRLVQSFIDAPEIARARAQEAAR